MTTFPVLDGFIAHPLLAAGKKSSNSKMLKEWEPKRVRRGEGSAMSVMSVMNVMNVWGVEVVCDECEEYDECEGRVSSV